MSECGFLLIFPNATSVLFSFTFAFGIQLARKWSWFCVVRILVDTFNPLACQLCDTVYVMCAMLFIYILSAASSCWSLFDCRLIFCLVFCVSRRFVSHSRRAPNLCWHETEAPIRPIYTRSRCVCCVPCTHPAMLCLANVISIRTPPTRNSLASKSFREMIMITEVYHSIWQRMSERANTHRIWMDRAHNSRCADTRRSLELNRNHKFLLRSFFYSFSGMWMNGWVRVLADVHNVEYL